MRQTRRTFIKHSGLAAGIGLFGLYGCGNTNPEEKETKDEKNETATISEKPGALFFKISLAQWSLHNTFFSGELDNLDFAATAKNKFGIDAIEYVNQFFKDKAEDKAYINELKTRADDNGVTSLLIMVDGEGGLAEIDNAVRKQAIENHYKWIDAAKFLGCHSIRVNAFSQSESPEDAAKAAVEGLGTLAEHAKNVGLNIIVENHGGYSSDGKWLSGVMSQIGMDNCGTLPDFGNFCIKRDGENYWSGKCINEYDRYLGVTELMPFAKAVSAKAFDFDDSGNEINTDYVKMMKIVKDAGYRGYVGIEYEGEELSEVDGIMATKALLEKVSAAI